MASVKKYAIGIFLIGLLAYLILLIPENQSDSIVEIANKPFEWNQDEIWNSLEAQFITARKMEPANLDSNIAKIRTRFHTQLTRIRDSIIFPGDLVFDHLLSDFFEMAALTGAKENVPSAFLDDYNQTRIAVKKQSQHWDIKDPTSRNTIYKVLYGMRAAVEEILLQSDMKFPAAMHVVDEYSATPGAEIFGIKVHSGDLLVSRGGAEVSALISRGNDYPGNFSHVALVYVEQGTNTPSIIESHIEKGVDISTLAQYTADQKLRFMVLRPRADLPELVSDPMLPHKAARVSYQETQKRHIPYDFKMDFHNSSAMFCSEVGSYGYNSQGIDLWQAISTISSRGTVNWLRQFGVEHFVTQMPSDLEYDPQLSIVAEWRDAETLYKDHIDNAVMDVMLEGAHAGEEVAYNRWLLPFIRILKGYSMLLNKMGKVGKIPEGMSATQALKNLTVIEQHANLKARTEQKAEQFLQQNGYRPPYWQLIELARRSSEENISSE